jgi:hypothetical protein
VAGCLWCTIGSFGLSTPWLFTKILQIPMNSQLCERAKVAVVANHTIGNNWGHGYLPTSLQIKLCTVTEVGTVEAQNCSLHRTVIIFLVYDSHNTMANLVTTV